MNQLFTPPWISMSRRCRSDALVVSSLVTSIEPEERPRRVPLLPERGLRPGQGRTAQLPVGVQPVRVAGHGDDPVLDAGMIERPGRQDGDRAAGRRSRRRAGAEPARPPPATFAAAALPADFFAVAGGTDNARIN